MVRYYTREGGCALVGAELSKICRKVVKGLQLKKKLTPQVVVTEDNLPDYLGVRKYTYGRAEQQNQIGQVVGLAWMRWVATCSPSSCDHARQGCHYSHRITG